MEDESCTEENGPELQPVFEVEERSCLSDHAPKDIYEPITFLKSNPDILLQDIMLVDFGGSTMADTSPSSKQIAINLSYTAPEIQFEKIRIKESDMWALACCLTELRSGKQLFRGNLFGGGITQTMVETLGPLPRHWHEQLPRWELFQTPRELEACGLDNEQRRNVALRTKIERIVK